MEISVEIPSLYCHESIDSLAVFAVFICLGLAFLAAVILRAPMGPLTNKYRR